MRNKNAKLLKEALRKKYIIGRKLKNIQKESKIVEEKKNRLGGIIQELEKFSLANYGASLKMAQVKKGSGRITPAEASGVWIVEKRGTDKNHEGYIAIQLAKVSELVSSDKALRFSIGIEPEMNMKGEDGKEVTFNVGELLVVNYEGDMQTQGGQHRFHFANIEASGEQGKLIHDIALSKLGLAPKPITKEGQYLIVDGNFRRRE